LNKNKKLQPALTRRISFYIIFTTQHLERLMLK
jgi:hypothetical protein